MNRFFDPETTRTEPPRRVHARLDHHEPPDLAEAKEAVFVLDAVDADWPGFAPGGPFDLRDGERLGASLAAYWRARFDGQPSDEPDPYDRAPLFRIELTCQRGEAMFDRMREVGDAWLDADLGSQGEIEVDVFAGLFAAPAVSYLHRPPAPSAHPQALSAVFDMDTWPDAATNDVAAALSPQCEPETLAVFDVGQGSANALVCRHGYPVLYHDMGCGVFRNAFTKPGPLSFCLCANTTVVMSHWDTDHWAGAARDRKALACTWVVPRQQISSSHTTFANDILKAGGRILVMPSGASAATRSGPVDIELRRGTGTDRNGSGIVMIARHMLHDRAWLLTGDAAYHYIPPPLPADFAAIVVPHHGADMGARSIPPPRPAAAYARLAYSFGPGNKHGRTSVQHPTRAALTAHAGTSWSHGSWTLAAPGTCVAGPDVLATAEHAATHLDGALIDWLGHLSPPPSPPIHCGAPVTQT